MIDLPCAIVYDAIEPAKDTNGKIYHRCGLRFQAMSDDHKNKLNFFLSNYTTGVVKRRNLPNILLKRVRNIYSFFLPMLFDLLLITLALVGVQFLKRGHFELTTRYLQLFSVFYIGWFAVSVGMDKYRKILQSPFFKAMAVIVKSNVVLVYAISFAIVLFPNLSNVSREQTFGSCLAFFLLESIVYLIYTVVRNSSAANNGNGNAQSFQPTEASSYPLIVIDAGLLLMAFFLMNLLKRGNLSPPPSYDLALLLLYALWGASSFYMKKYKRSIFNSTFSIAFNHCIRASLMMVAGLGLIIFAFRLFYYSRLQLFGALGLLLGLEAIAFYLYWLYRKQGRIGKDIETSDEVRNSIKEQENSRELPVETCDGGLTDPVDIKLRHALEFLDPKLYDFIANTIDLSAIDRCATTLISSEEINALDVLPNNGQQLFVNLHKTNDVRWFNRYFLQVYRKLKNHGYFIGKVHTFRTHKLHYLEKYPRLFAELFYYINCIWCRIFPKLPYFKKFYFTLTRGRNRMVSKAEIFGRLYFCGFKVVADMESGNRLYFIAQKSRMPAYQTNPTYGPLVQLKRFGFDGKSIPVYKFRTMYPYSEFLQEYVYEHNELDSGGKFKDDFRVTGWGKFMRATWLDELPMIYNWLKGDMKLFGVRPISKQYLSLYTDELKELRKKVVPGLIPPFYADLPKTLPEIIESEIRYIKSYLKSPVKTQLSYLWRSFDNIVLKGARSK